MNDRYLYRAKRCDTGEWVEGYIVELGKESFSDEIRFGITEKAVPILGKTVFNLSIDEIDPSTICQCTGLKDKHGKLIFENDIVKRVDKRNDRHIFREQPSMNCKVVWTYNYGFDTLPSCGYFDKSDGLECEVVGNIFDNLELLEGGE